MHLLAGICFIVAFAAIWLLNRAFEISPETSPWNPSAGMCLGLLLVLGPRHTLTVFIAIILSHAVQLHEQYGGWRITPSIVIYGLIAALMYLLGERFLVRIMRFDAGLHTQRAVGLLVLTSMVLPVPLAIYAASVHSQLGVVAASQQFEAIFHYWVVEAIGLLTITPVVLLLVNRGRWSLLVPRGVTLRTALRWMTQSTALAAAVWCMFFWPMDGAFQSRYLVVPPLVWIVLRCGLSGGVGAMLAVNVTCTMLAWSAGLGEPLISGLQAFLLVVTSSALLFGALAESIRDGQQRAAANEERYRGLFESNPQPMWVTDRAGQRFIAVNDAALAQYGYEREAFLLMDVSDLSTEVAGASHETTIVMGLNASPGVAIGVSVPPAPRTTTASHRRENGTTLDVQLTSMRMHLGESDVRLMVTRDITEAVQATLARERAESALRLALLRLVSLVEHSPLALIEWDGSFHILRWSGRAPEIFGWQSHEVLGRHPTDWHFVYGDDALAVSEVMSRLRAGESPFTLKNRNITKDGRVIWCQWHNSVIRDEAGQVQSVLSLVADVTERESAHAVIDGWKNRYEAASKASRQLVYELDPASGQILWGSDTLPVLQVAPERLSRLVDWIALIHPADWPAYELAKLHLAEGSDIFQLEYRVMRGDGTYVWIADTARAFTDANGHKRGLVGFVADISEQANAREELARRAKELARSNADLERFASVASHDLREPLRMVTSFTRMLADRYRGKLDADADEMIHFALDGAERMQRMIEDLLTYSRVGAPIGAVEAVDANYAAARAAANLRVAIDEAGASVTIGDLPLVLAEPTRLTLVFQNIVANALKFRRMNEVPRVLIVAVREPGMWRFEISDNGIGIDEKHNQRIFEMFQRLNPRAQYQGNGIGLAICKRIIDDLGGELSVRSTLGEGSTFSFTLRPAS